MGRHPLPEAERERRRVLVESLSLQGFTVDQIVEQSGLYQQVVHEFRRPLIAAGRIAHNYKRTCFAKDADNQKTKDVLDMHRRGATLKEIGEKYGITRERARQWLALIAKFHGEEIMENDFFTTYDVAEIMGVSYSTALKYSEKPANKSRLRISSSELHNIARKIKESDFGKCHKCRKEFRSSESGHTMYCSDECAIYIIKHRRMNGIATRRRGWIRDLSECGRFNSDPGGFIGLRDAMNITGLSQMQISWLRISKLARVIEYPENIHRVTDKPCHLYSENDVRLAGEVYRKFHSRRRA